MHAYIHIYNSCIYNTCIHLYTYRYIRTYLHSYIHVYIHHKVPMMDWDPISKLPKSSNMRYVCTQYLKKILFMYVPWVPINKKSTKSSSMPKDLSYMYVYICMCASCRSILQMQKILVGQVRFSCGTKWPIIGLWSTCTSHSRA